MNNDHSDDYAALGSELIWFSREQQRNNTKALAGKFLDVLRIRHGEAGVINFFTRLEQGGGKEMVLTKEETKILQLVAGQPMRLEGSEKTRRAFLKSALGGGLVVAGSAGIAAAYHYDIPDDDKTWASSMLHSAGKAGTIASGITIALGIKTFFDAYFIARKGLSLKDKDKMSFSGDQAVKQICMIIEEQLAAIHAKGESHTPER